MATKSSTSPANLTSQEYWKLFKKEEEEEKYKNRYDSKHIKYYWCRWLAGGTDWRDVEGIWKVAGEPFVITENDAHIEGTFLSDRWFSERISKSAGPQYFALVGLKETLPNTNLSHKYYDRSRFTSWLGSANSASYIPTRGMKQTVELFSRHSSIAHCSVLKYDCGYKGEDEPVWGWGSLEVESGKWSGRNTTAKLHIRDMGEWNLVSIPEFTLKKDW